MDVLTRLLRRFGFVRVRDYGLQVGPDGRLVPAPAPPMPPHGDASLMPPISTGWAPPPGPEDAPAFASFGEAAAPAAGARPADEEEWEWRRALAQARADAEDDPGNHVRPAQDQAQMKAPEPVGESTGVTGETTRRRRMARGSAPPLPVANSPRHPVEAWQKPASVTGLAAGSNSPQAGGAGDLASEHTGTATAPAPRKPGAPKTQIARLCPPRPEVPEAASMPDTGTATRPVSRKSESSHESSQADATTRTDATTRPAPRRPAPPRPARKVTPPSPPPGRRRYSVGTSYGPPPIPPSRRPHRRPVRLPTREEITDTQLDLGPVPEDDEFFDRETMVEAPFPECEHAQVTVMPGLATRAKELRRPRRETRDRTPLPRLSKVLSRRS